MMTMILAAAAAFAPVQARTVEERLKELEDKLAVLEKRNKALDEENQALEKRIVDAKAAKETFARQMAVGWVKRYAKPVDLTEKQSAELEELWLGWSRADLEKAADAAAWKSREQSVRGKLTGGQAPRLARAVRDEQEKMARMSLSSYVQAAKISADHVAGFEKAALAKVAFSEEALLLQAHPEKQVGWPKITAAVEESLPDLAAVLSEEELARLRETLAKWRPRK